MAKKKTARILDMNTMDYITDKEWESLNIHQSIVAKLRDQGCLPDEYNLREVVVIRKGKRSVFVRFKPILSKNPAYYWIHRHSIVEILS